MADFVTYTSSITATANSTAVTGSGTAFVTDGMREGDWLWFLESSGPVGYPVASVESATALTLATAYKGSTGGSKSAIGERRWDEEKASDTYRLVNSYIQSLEDTVSVSQAGIRYLYSSTTAMADPGPGYFRLNNATPSSATAIAFADESGETANPDASAFINSFDDSTSAVKGYIYVKKAGEPSTFMIYAVTGLTDNAGWSQVAVTYVTGNGSMTNNDACRMEFYRVGNDGFENGLKFTYSTTTTDADPGSGIFRFNNSTFGSITSIFMDNADANGVTVTTLLDSWDDSSNTTHRGALRFQKIGDPTVFREFSITGAVTDGTGYRKIAVAPSVSNGTWTNGDSFVILFTRTGNKGADGYVPGFKFTYSTTTTDSDPGAGTLRANNATFGSITQLFVDNTDSAGATITAWLDSLDDSTDTVRGVLRLEAQNDTTIYREFQVTGSVTDGTGYRKITVSPVVSNGSWTNGLAINATFYRTGEAGTDGYDPGFRFAFSTTTTDSDPGAGTVRFDNANAALATYAYIDNADAAAADIAAWLDGMDDSTESNHKGYLRIQKIGDPTIYREFVVTGTVVNGTGYRKVPIDLVAEAGSFSNGMGIVAHFTRTGSAGTNGTNGTDGYQSGYRLTYSTTTTAADPGAGTVRMNNLVMSSVTAIYIDNTDATGATITTWLDGLDDSDSSIRGYLRFQDATDPANYAEFGVNGAVVDSTGYRTVPVAAISSSGSWANGDTLVATFYRSGSAGSATIGDGDKGDITVSGTGSIWTINIGSVDNSMLADTDLQDIASRWTPASISGAASLAFLEDADNGTNKVTLTGPSSIASDIVVTLPATAGTLATLAGTETLSNKSFSSAPLPSTDDGAALGSTSFKWSDLWLASGAVINWNAGDVTLTHSADQMAWDGATQHLFRQTGAAVTVRTGRLDAHGIADVGYFGFWGRDSAANDQEYARITGGAGAVTNGSEYGNITFGTANGSGVLTNYAFLNKDSFGPVSNGTLPLGYAGGRWSALYVNSIELGADSDTTFARLAAGDVGIEGKQIISTATLTITAANQAAARTNISAALKGHIFGLTLSNNGTDATNDIDIAAGEAASTETNPVLMVLASALTKRLDAAWAVGTNQGGLDTGSIANTTYHVWLIQRSDTGVVDALFSTSATSPTMPTNYDRKRRIGSVMRASAAIRAFKQDGDVFSLTTGVVDRNSTAAYSSALLTLTVPAGIECFPLCTHAAHVNTGTINQALGSASAGSTTAQVNGISDTNYGRNDSANLPIFKTNTSSQLYYSQAVADTLIAASITTVGWVDTRGKDA